MSKYGAPKPLLYMKSLTKIIGAGLLATALYGCGGTSSSGGGSSNNPTTPEPTANYLKTDKPLNLYTSTINPQNNEKQARLLDRSIKFYAGNEEQVKKKLHPFFFLHNNKNYISQGYNEHYNINDREDTWSKHQSTSTISTDLGNILQVYFNDNKQVKHTLPFSYQNNQLEILTTPTINFTGIDENSSGTYNIMAKTQGSMTDSYLGKMEIMGIKKSCEQDPTRERDFFLKIYVR